MRIGFANYAVPNCGVHQYAANLFEALRASTKLQFVYFPISSLAELDELVRSATCKALFVNYHPQTMPFLNIRAKRRYSIPVAAIMHEMTQAEADAMADGLFQYYVMGDPTLAENNPRVFKTGRLIPEFQSAQPMPKELTFGSFGFSVGSKGFTRLIDVVQQEFDDATIRVNIPPNGIIDVDAKQAKRVADACSARIWKPGIKFSATHDFLTQDGLLEFLAGNTLNSFLYDYLPKAGISSAVDQALTVRRPVAITRSVMFRHLFDLSPPITIENASLHEIIGRGIEPYADLLREWSPANLVARYEQIVDTMLSAQAAPAASGRPPQIDRRAVPQSSENSMGHLAKRIARGLARRARGHVLTPGRQFAKALQVRITVALGITTSKSRFNRILDDAARAEYADD